MQCKKACNKCNVGSACSGVNVCIKCTAKKPDSVIISPCLVFLSHCDMHALNAMWGMHAINALWKIHVLNAIWEMHAISAIWVMHTINAKWVMQGITWWTALHDKHLHRIQCVKHIVN